jgi:membrane protein DedA with SNARE-associated domain
VADENVVDQETQANPWDSPRFKQIVNWVALAIVAVLFVIPRVSPFDGLNSALNDLNVFRRFSEWLIAKTESLFKDYGYYVVFFGVLAENSMFLGLLVPGAIILILAGLSSENGAINPVYVLGLAIAATMIGDTISYMIGRLGWAKFMEKGAMGKALDRVREPVESNSVWIILGYHFAGYSRVVGPVAAGLFQIPYRRWAPLDYAGGIAWVLVFTFAGYLLGVAGVEFGDTKRMVSIIEIALFAMFVIVVVVAFARFYQTRDDSGGTRRDTVIIPVESDDK